MSDLKTFWNKSSATIPDDKDAANYAVEKEKLFPRNSIVCDLGGGSGEDAIHFSQQGHQVTVIDISDLALSKAQANAEKQGLTIKTQQCDLSSGELPLQADTYDIVYSRLALHYFRPAVLAQLFAGVYTALKPQGVAYLTVKSPDDEAEMKYLEETTEKLEDGVYGEDGHIKTRYSVEQLEQILAHAGMPKGAFTVKQYTEQVGGRKDRIKSGNKQLLVNEIKLQK